MANVASHLTFWKVSWIGPLLLDSMNKSKCQSTCFLHSFRDIGFGNFQSQHSCLAKSHSAMFESSAIQREILWVLPHCELISVMAGIGWRHLRRESASKGKCTPCAWPLVPITSMHPPYPYCITAGNISTIIVYASMFKIISLPATALFPLSSLLV